MTTNLLDLDSKEMEAYFSGLGEKPFRAKQMMRWVHKQRQMDFSKMTNISLHCRELLSESATVKVPIFSHPAKDLDGTLKWLLVTDKHNAVETVFIPERKRGTLCVSSQVGCALDCSFCATGKQGFNRNLSTGEIIGQLWNASRYLESQHELSREGEFALNGGRGITNIVMMGMGEPLANYKNVVRALRIMTDNDGYGYSRRKVTVSTSGIIPNMEKLMNDCPVSLAVSLHAADDDLRDKLVPINQKYPLRLLLEACRRYVYRIQDNGMAEDKLSQRDFITFEYVMLKGINDSIAHAKLVGNLLQNIPCKINLIPFNNFENSNYESSQRDNIYRFRDILKNQGYVCTIRRTRGVNTQSACGQLAGEVYDKTKRTLNSSLN